MSVDGRHSSPEAGAPLAAERDSGAAAKPPPGGPGSGAKAAAASASASAPRWLTVTGLEPGMQAARQPRLVRATSACAVARRKCAAPPPLPLPAPPACRVVAEPASVGAPPFLFSPFSPAAEACFLAR